jgi:hypothetical protein
MTADRLSALGVLEKIEVANVQHAAGLQVLGLKWPSTSDLVYMTLDEALRDEAIEVVEISESGQVKTINVVNRSHSMVFLMAGELLLGCKQDRVLNTSIMVPETSQISVPVACVEAGRWDYRSRSFRSAGSSSHSHLRTMMSRQAYEHYQSCGVPGSDQTAIWGEVARKLGRMGSSSPSDALRDMFEQSSAKLEEAQRSLSVPEGCNGVAFAHHGEIVGVDLFDCPATLTKLWAKLITSYAVDALENPRNEANSVSPQAVVNWLKNATSAKLEWFDSPGVGQDGRIEGSDLIGSTLVVQGHPVHIELFSEKGER